MFLLAAFALDAWRGRWNWAALCAALFLLLWMAGLLADTSFFLQYHAARRDIAAYLCRCLALSALLCAWLLWRKEGRFYRWFAPLSAIGLGGLLCAALFEKNEVLEKLQSAFAGQSFTYFLWPLTSIVVGGGRGGIRHSRAGGPGIGTPHGGATNG